MWDVCWTSSASLSLDIGGRIVEGGEGEGEGEDGQTVKINGLLHREKMATYQTSRTNTSFLGSSIFLNVREKT